MFTRVTTKRLFKTIYTIPAVIILSVSIMAVAFAADSSTVSISVNSPQKTVSSETFTANVTVRFNDASLWNEQTKLAYHVYDISGNEVRFESERYSFEIDTDGIGTVGIPVTLAGLGKSEYIVQFDMIDEAWPRWYSALEDYRNLNEMSPVVKGEYDQILYKRYTALTYLADHRLVITVHLLLFIGVIAAMIQVRTKRMRGMKR